MHDVVLSLFNFLRSIVQLRRYNQHWTILATFVQVSFYNMIFISLEPGDLGSIHYDDAAIDNLLDRNRAGLEEKSLLANEYLASFKVGLLFLPSWILETTITLVNRRSLETIAKAALIQQSINVAAKSLGVFPRGVVFSFLSEHNVQPEHHWINNIQFRFILGCQLHCKTKRKTG